jgi:SAM-dependent methyltransferase
MKIEATRAFGRKVDFGRTASDYSQFRVGFPQAFFTRLTQQIGETATALDIGTGTGTLARGFAGAGYDVTGLDPSRALLDEAAALSRADGVKVRYIEGKAEALPFPDETFDLVTAGQCWHWFDRPLAAREAMRVLRPGGALVIAHFDWLPLLGNVVAATEDLILEFNPGWTMSGTTGIYPHWLTDMAAAGFKALETASFDVSVPYSPEGWRGRIRASAPVKASLDDQATLQFDEQLRDMLAIAFPANPLAIPHRVWWAMGRKPETEA